MNAKLILPESNEELFKELSEKAMKHLERDHNIVISSPRAIPTIAVSFITQLLKEANGWDLRIRKDENGNIVIAKEETHDHPIDTLLTLNIEKKESA